MEILFGVVALLIFFGIAIKHFKWYFLISGYNTMSKKKKENVDIDGLGKLMANFMFILAAIIGLSGFLQMQGYKNLSMIIMLLMIPMIIILIINSQKFDHNKRSIKDNKIEFIVGMGIILLTLVIVSGILIVGIIEPKVEVNQDKIIISGLYKRNIDISQIVEITIEDTMPKVLNKVNGFDFGYTLRGSFNLEGVGPSNIYVQENQSPFINIKTADRLYIINYKDSEQTHKLYEDIIKP